MVQRIKKSLFVFFFTLLGLFSFVQPAEAGWVKDLLVGFATLPIFSIVWLLVKFAVWWAGFAGSFLNWVLSPSFISLSYTNPANNPIIRTGLGVTQGFVNMLLVLILVYIAIATILRLAGYETKKLLITFIIVALLVNFAPVICGLIVDASNIVMNFFIQDLKADAFGKAMGVKVDQISFEFDESLTMTNYKYILQLAVMVPFLIILGNILCLFALIFILRYLVIWLLVILSPLAFACYILPITKKYFDKWWEQFINWSIIGITCGFFLYLALLLVVNIPTSINPPNTEEGTLFNAILPYFVSVIFLGLGAVFGLQTSAMGASTVISGVKRTQKASTKWVGRAAGRGIKQQIESKLRTKEAAHRVTKAVERIPLARWFLPETFRKYGEFRPTIDAEQKRLEPYSSREISHRIAQKADIGTRATGGIMELVKRGDMQDLVSAYKKKYKKSIKAYTKKHPEVSEDEALFKINKFKKELEGPLKAAFQSGYQSKLLRSDPRMARIAAGKKWGLAHKDMTEEESVRLRTNEARRTHIANWEREVVEDKTVVDTLMGRGREVFEAIDTQVKRGQETALNTIDKIFSEYIDNVLAKESPDTAQSARQKDPKATEEAWSKFREHFKTTHKGNEGYFKALKEDPRFAARGWREGQYIKPGTPPSAPTAGAAAMGSPPPSGRRPGGGAGPAGKRPGGASPSGRRPGGRKKVESRVVKSEPLQKSLPPSAQKSLPPSPEE